MQALILLVLSIGVFVGIGMSQPAPAADFVVEAGELLNDKFGTSNKAEDAARNTIQLFVRGIKMDDTDAFFKLVAHTEEDKKYAREIFSVWRGVSMAVISSKQSGDDKIIVLVLFTFVNGDKKNRKNRTPTVRQVGSLLNFPNDSGETPHNVSN